MKKKLINIYPFPRQTGIFFRFKNDSIMSQIFTTLNVITDDDYHALDIDYIYNHSGDKTISTALDYLYSNRVDDMNGRNAFAGFRAATWESIVDEVSDTIIQQIIKNKFANKWQQLATSTMSEIDNFNAYHMEVSDKIEGSLESSDTNKSTTSSSGSNSGTSKDGTTSKDNIFAFNSTGEVPTDSSEGERNTEESSEYSDNGSRKSDGTYNRTDSSQRTITRKGNIGNKSPAQLVEEFRTLMLYQIYDIIYKDLDSVLTRSKYIF